MIVKGITDIGLRRSSNQDCFFADKIGDVYVGVVCDGMGGMDGGDIASVIARDAFVSGLREQLEGGLAAGADANGYRDAMLIALAKANDAVYSEAKSKPELRGMGTTLVAGLVQENGMIYAVNIGDSRLYKIENGGESLKQITRDHSLVQELVDNGDLTPEEAEHYPAKNVITRALGVSGEAKAEAFFSSISGDTLLLCSDGLYNCVKRDDILRIINENPDIDECLRKLVEQANAGGGGDNITAVILRNDVD
jgi:protein phosphatase